MIYNRAYMLCPACRTNGVEVSQKEIQMTRSQSYAPRVCDECLLSRLGRVDYNIEVRDGMSPMQGAE